MRVISSSLVLNLLEIAREDAAFIVDTLQMNVEQVNTSSNQYDLKIAKSHLRLLERQIQSFKEHSFTLERWTEIA